MPGMISLTPLHLAVRDGRNDIVEILLDRGVAIDVQDIKKLTPLHLAILAGREDIVVNPLQGVLTLIYRISQTDATIPSSNEMDAMIL